MSSAKRLAREILDTRRLALGHATSPQLTSSAIDGGQLDITDGDGNRVGGLGLGDDGGFKIDYTGGPKPPKPSPPTVTADAGIFRIEWDGSFVNEGDDGVLATSDTDRVEIHASMDENFVPDRVESFGGAFATLDGGSFTLGPLPEAGTYYFRLVARSKSAQFSEPSDRVEQVLAIASIDLEITDAWLTGEAAQNTADGKNSIWRGPDEPEADPDRPFKDGDIWFEMVDGKSIPNIWDETAGAWVANDDYRQSEIERVQQELRDELDTIVVDGSGTKNFYTPDMPTEGMSEGDLWFDSSDKNKPYIYQDGQWITVQSSFVSPGAGEILASSLSEGFFDKAVTSTPDLAPAPEDETRFEYSGTATGAVSVTFPVLGAADPGDLSMVFDGTEASKVGLGLLASMALYANSPGGAPTFESVFLLELPSTGEITPFVIEIPVDEGGGGYAGATHHATEVDENTATLLDMYLRLGLASRIAFGIRVTFPAVAGAWAKVMNLKVTQTLGGDGIADGAITETKVSDDAISTPKLQAGAIVAGKIAANAIETDHLDSKIVTTDKIAAGAITAESGIIGSINAGTITVGEMDGARIKAGTVSASSIAVGDFSNLATIDPVRNVNVTRPENWSTETVGDYITPKATSQNYLMFKDRTNTVPFKAGDQLRVEFKGVSDVNGSAQIRLWGYPALADGTTSGLVGVSGDSFSFTTTEQSFSGKVTIPESFGASTALRSWIIGLGPLGGLDMHGVRVRDVRVYRMTGQTLLQDGAITTDKIAVGAITAESGIIGSIDANVITVGKIMGNQLDADAINGKTITGAKIRTASSGSRVELTHNGLKQYNSLGATIVDMTAGSFTLQGGSITGSTIKTASSGSRVEINTQGLKQYNSSNEVIAEMVGGSMVMTGVLEQENSVAKLQVGPAFAQSVSPGLMWSNVAGTSKYAGIATRGGSSASLVAQGPRGSSSSGAYGYLSLAEEGSYLTYRAGGDDGNQTSYLNLTPSAYNLLAYNSSDILVSGLWSSETGTYLRDTASTGYQQDFYMQDRKIWTGWRNSGGTIGASLYLDNDGITFYVNATSRRLMLDAGNVAIPTLPGDSGAVPIGRKSGRLYYVSSARRFKILEEPITDTVDSFEDRLLSVDAKTWIDKTRADRIADYETAIALGEEPEGGLADCGGLERIPGVVAEDLEAAGLDMFVTYNDDGETESVLYDRIGPALIPIVRSLRDRIEALEAQLASA